MNHLLKLLALITVLPLAAWAQNQTIPPPTSSQTYGPEHGNMEFTLGGAGATNKDFDDSFGGLNFSLGSFLSNNLELLVRQSVNYTNPNNAGSAWNGATRVAIDEHLGSGPVRPFLGANFGRVYGDSVRDTWAAGIEGGAKFYVMPRTFIYTTVEYGWFFQHARGINDRFDDGQFNWSAGVGFNF